MKNKWTSLLIGGMLLVMAVGLTQAQELQPPQQLAAPQAETGANAAVSAYIPVQGRLTDAGGNPVPNGNYNITASIYNVSSGGTALCFKSQSVSVSNGLFNMTIDNCTSAILNGQQLYLGIKVGTDDEMNPRQPIYPVPYAWSLRPGAVISDTRDGILTVRSTGTGDSDALRAYAGGSGEAMEAYATDGVGMFALSENYLALQGYSRDNTDNPAIFGCSGSNTVCDPYRDDGAIGVMGVVSGTAGYGIAGFQTGYSTGDKTAYWESGGLFGGRNGVIGISKESDGIGVLGWAQATAGNSRGIVGRTDSSTGWAGYFATDAGNGVYGHSKTGIAIQAAGTGIIQSTADTQIAVSPLKMVTHRQYVSTVILRPDWTGYMVVEPSSSGTTITIVPVDLPNLLFGTALKLKSIQVCYRCNNAGSYISATYVGWRTDSGYYDAISNVTDRTATSWTCYTVADSVPDIITGPIYIDFNFNFANTGTSHSIEIGKIILTLTEQ